MTENLEMQRERAAAIKTYQTEMNEVHISNMIFALLKFQRSK